MVRPSDADLAVALACLRDYVPPEDREQAEVQAFEAGRVDAHGWSKFNQIVRKATLARSAEIRGEARRLMKLDGPAGGCDGQ